MDLEQLRIFAALAESGSFTAAGKRLYKSHPSVSRTVAELERELGVTLAVRDRRSCALTEAGRTLYERGKELLAAAAALEKSVKEAETK